MSYRAMFGVMGLLFSLIVVSGCSVSRVKLGDDIKSEVVATLQKGVTTRSEVVDRLGAPDRVVTAHGRDIFQYYHYDAKSNCLCLLVLNFARSTIKSDDLYVFLDKNGLVDEVVFGKRTPSMTFRFWPFKD